MNAIKHRLKAGTYMFHFVDLKNKVIGIFCIMMIISVVGICGCSTTRYTQNTMEQNDDDATSYRIKNALTADSEHMDYEGVKVETFKRVVQLSGFVNTQEIKTRAGELARIDAGSRDIKNNITVKE